MSTVVVGCDENQGNDSEVQNTICKAIEKQGHTVEKLDIKPGPFGAYDWGENGKNPKGKIGVYIIADGLTSIADHYDNPGGFKYVYFVIRGDLGRPKMDSRKDFENNPIGKDWHGDCTSKSCGTLAGKSFTQINEMIVDVAFDDEILINVKSTIDKLICSVNNVKELIEHLYTEFVDNPDAQAVLPELIATSEVYRGLEEEDFVNVIRETISKINHCRQVKETEHIKSLYKGISDDDPEALKLQIQLRDKIKKLRQKSEKF